MLIEGRKNREIKKEVEEQLLITKQLEQDLRDQQKELIQISQETGVPVPVIIPLPEPNKRGRKKKTAGKNVGQIIEIFEPENQETTFH